MFVIRFTHRETLVTGKEISDMAKATKEQIKYIDEWQKENLKRITIKLNKHTDADILEYLDGLDNRQGYLKALIREDMERLANEIK